MSDTIDTHNTVSPLEIEATQQEITDHESEIHEPANINDDDISINSIITSIPEQIVNDEDFMGENYREMHTYSGRVFQRIKFWWLRNVASGRTLRRSTNAKGIALYDLDPQGNEIHNKFTDLDHQDANEDSNLKHKWSVPGFDVPSIHRGIPFVGRLTVPQILVSLALSALVLYLLIEIIVTSNDAKTTALSRINTHGFNPFITYSNGTSTFNPITIVLKINNFHPSLISESRTPLLSKLFLRGNGRMERSPVLDGLSVVSAAYMIPMFPLLDIPNMWSMVTGLYPYNHGHIYSSVEEEEEEDDKNIDEERFNHNDDNHNDDDDDYDNNYKYVKRRLHARTGKNYPIWSQLQKAYFNDGNYVFKAAVDDNWSKIVEPERKKAKDFEKGQGINDERLNRYEPFYNIKGYDKDTVERIFDLIDFNDIDNRPQLIMDTLVDFGVYTFENGYNLSNNNNTSTSSEFNKELFKLDTLIGDLLYHLKKRNLQEFTNILLLSNYGINTVEQHNIIKYSDLVSKTVRQKKIIESVRFEGSMVFISARWKSKNEVYTDILKNVEKIHGVKVYLVGKLPELFKLNGRNKNLNKALGDILIVPERGYTIIDDTNKKQRKKYLKFGNKDRYFGFDGYDYDYGYTDEATNITMRSMFIGIGPYFTNNNNNNNNNTYNNNNNTYNNNDNNAMIRPFENIEIYEMISNICGLNERDRTRARDSHSRKDLIELVYTEEEYRQDDFESLRAAFGDDSTYNVIFKDVIESTPKVGSTSDGDTTADAAAATVESSPVKSMESSTTAKSDPAEYGDDSYATEEDASISTYKENHESAVKPPTSKILEPEKTEINTELNTESKSETAASTTTEGNVLDIIEDLLDDAKEFIDDIIDKIHLPDDK